MTIKFAIRGSSMDAYLNSGAGKTPMNYVPQGYTLPAVVADAAAIGGQAIDVNGAGGNLRGLIYPGFSNCPKTGQLSILHRFAPAYSGSPSTNNSIISICAPRFLSSIPSMMIQLAHLTTGNLTLNMYNNAGSAIVTANTIVAAWSPTAGTYYDICLVWDGTMSANRIKVYVNGVLQGSGVTAGQVLGSGNTANFSDILIGSGHHSILSGDYKTNEYVIWDATIDPTSGGLNLNGASRASFVTISGTLDPTNSTDPGIANVRSSTGYVTNGVSLTGTAAIPTAANVRSGTATDATTGTLAVPAVGNVRSGTAVDNTTGTLVVPSLANTKTGVAGDGGTGTYDGSDRWTDVGITNVRSGSAYKANSTSNNRTGTAAIPTAANVRSGTSTDATTGTLAVPAASDVRLGVSVDATVGTLHQNTLSTAVVKAQSSVEVSDTILEITQGDSAQLSLTAQVGDDTTAFDLTGATFETKIKKQSGTYQTIPNSQHTADADQITNKGSFTISLLTSDTAKLKLGSGRDIVTKVTQGSEVTYFHGVAILTILTANPS
jgi:hypothetical protein